MMLTRISESETDEVLGVYRAIRKWRDTNFERSKETSFVILHAPLRYVDIPLLVIGQNPGGIKDDPHYGQDGWCYEEEGCPDENFLFNSTHRYAFTAQALFYRAERLNHLRFSQSTDVNFFRALGTTEALRQSSKGLRRIMSTLRPKRFLINGKHAAASFMKEFRSVPRLRTIKYGPMADHNDVFVSPHFSRRTDPSMAEWKRVISDLRDFLPEDIEQNLAQVEFRK